MNSKVISGLSFSRNDIILRLIGLHLRLFNARLGEANCSQKCVFFSSGFTCHGSIDCTIDQVANLSGISGLSGEAQKFPRIGHNDEAQDEGIQKLFTVQLNHGPGGPFMIIFLSSLPGKPKFGKASQRVFKVGNWWFMTFWRGLCDKLLFAPSTQ